MLDPHEARLWADHHLALGRFVRRVAEEIAESFRVLARLQYDQPWRRPAPVKVRPKALHRR